MPMPEYRFRELGQRLRALREVRGYTQEQVAEACGVQRATVTQWESGRRRPRLEHLEIMADLYDVTVDDLTGNKPYAEGRFPDSDDRPPDRWLEVFLKLASALEHQSEANARTAAAAERAAAAAEKAVAALLGADASARVQGHSEAAAVDAGD